MGVGRRNLFLANQPSSLLFRLHWPPLQFCSERFLTTLLVLLAVVVENSCSKMSQLLVLAAKEISKFGEILERLTLLKKKVTLPPPQKGTDSL